MGGSARKEQGAHSGALAVLTPLRCPVQTSFVPHRRGGHEARAGPVGGQTPARSSVRGQSHRAQAPSCPCPVPPGGRGSAGARHVPGPPAQGREQGWEGPGAGPRRAGLCLRTLGNGELWRQREGKQLRSVRGAGGAVHAELGRVRPPCVWHGGAAVLP